MVQDTEARKAGLDKEHSALRSQHTKQAQHLAELAGKSKTLEAEVSGAQKQRSQMIDALKRLNVLVISPLCVCDWQALNLGSSRGVEDLTRNLYM